MTDVTIETVGSDSTTDEVEFVKSRKVSKQNVPRVEKRGVKRIKKQKSRPKRIKLVKPAASSATSDFVSSSRRITRRVGLFSNGKTSTKVSRFEFVASEETKARVEQDLHKILNLACDNRNAVVATDKSPVHVSVNVSPKKCCHHKSSDKIKDNSVLSGPTKCNMASSSHQNTRRMFTSFDKNAETLSSSQTKKSSMTKKFSQSSQPKVELGGVINRLHATLNKKRRELFPGVSMRSTLKSELSALQKRIRTSRRVCSSTEILPGSVSSQTNTSPVGEADHTSPVGEAGFSLKPETFPVDNNQSVASFKLDFRPESLPYSAPIKDWLFSVPTKEERLFTNFDKELLEEKQLMRQDIMCNDYVCDNPDLLCTLPVKRGSKKYAIFTRASPDSDGHPTWQIQTSPHRPPVDSPSSSWNYLRCKMY